MIEKQAVNSCHLSLPPVTVTMLIQVRDPTLTNGYKPSISS